MLTVETLNAMSVQEFTVALGSIFEHSPWVAQRAARGRPFSSREQLRAALCREVTAASVVEQDALILAHPRLGTRGSQRAQLTRASAQEQSGAGLDACTDEQFARLLQLNEQYSARFALPFILAVRGHTPQSIEAELTRRLDNDVATERATALQQIALIAGVRLGAAVAPEIDSAAQGTQ